MNITKKLLLAGLGMIYLSQIPVANAVHPKDIRAPLKTGHVHWFTKKCTVRDGKKQVGLEIRVRAHTTYKQQGWSKYRGKYTRYEFQPQFRHVSRAVMYAKKFGSYNVKHIGFTYNWRGYPFVIGNKLPSKQGRWFEQKWTYRHMKGWRKDRIYLLATIDGKRKVCHGK